MNDLTSGTNPVRPIFVVEDDPALRESFKDILHFAGYTCITVASPREALHILSTIITLPKLIISDVRMPGMDGFQFLTAVRANRLWKHIPFLFVAGQKTIEPVKDDPTSGTVDYLSKPCEVSVLLDMIRQLSEPLKTP